MVALPSDFLPGPQALGKALRTRLPRFSRVQWLARTGSTNADLMARARTNDGILARPWLQGAHVQEQGRGRAGRSWQNREGANLMFSCAFDVFMPARQLPTLSPLIGLLACEALRSKLSPARQQRLTMKWPNDIVWDRGKLAGILIETSRSGTATHASDHHMVIAGIGINLDDARALSQSLERRVADWSEIVADDACAAEGGAVALVTAIAESWYLGLNGVTAHGLTDFAQRYARVDGLAGQALDVTDNGRLIQSGIACGVNEHGQLVLRNAGGEHALSVGEISVRAQS
ncbi:MAG: biotin--[acetyl-CoA-carboxylase] ligase [Alcaligenaceae bacterium]|nr:biotin--[acetyl-CoA-carboxylase] ligase [Alcaligenaceae bacterium]